MYENDVYVKELGNFVFCKFSSMSSTRDQSEHHYPKQSQNPRKFSQQQNIGKQQNYQQPQKQQQQQHQHQCDQQQQTIVSTPSGKKAKTSSSSLKNEHVHLERAIDMGLFADHPEWVHVMRGNQTLAQDVNRFLDQVFTDNVTFCVQGYHDETDGSFRTEVLPVRGIDVKHTFESKRFESWRIFNFHNTQVVPKTFIDPLLTRLFGSEEQHQDILPAPRNKNNICLLSNTCEHGVLRSNTLHDNGTLDSSSLSSTFPCVQPMKTQPNFVVQIMSNFHESFKVDSKHPDHQNNNNARGAGNNHGNSEHDSSKEAIVAEFVACATDCVQTPCSFAVPTSPSRNNNFGNNNNKKNKYTSPTQEQKNKPSDHYNNHMKPLIYSLLQKRIDRIVNITSADNHLGDENKNKQCNEGLEEVHEDEFDEGDDDDDNNILLSMATKCAIEKDLPVDPMSVQFQLDPSHFKLPPPVHTQHRNSSSGVDSKFPKCSFANIMSGANQFNSTNFMSPIAESPCEVSKIWSFRGELTESQYEELFRFRNNSSHQTELLTHASIIFRSPMSQKNGGCITIFGIHESKIPRTKDWIHGFYSSEFEKFHDYRTQLLMSDRRAIIGMYPTPPARLVPNVSTTDIIDDGYIHQLDEDEDECVEKIHDATRFPPAIYFRQTHSHDHDDMKSSIAFDAQPRRARATSTSQSLMNDGRSSSLRTQQAFHAPIFPLEFVPTIDLMTDLNEFTKFCASTWSIATMSKYSDPMPVTRPSSARSGFMGCKDCNYPVASKATRTLSDTGFYGKQLYPTQLKPSNDIMTMTTSFPSLNHYTGGRESIEANCPIISMGKANYHWIECRQKFPSYLPESTYMTMDRYCFDLFVTLMKTVSHSCRMIERANVLQGEIAKAYLVHIAVEKERLANEEAKRASLPGVFMSKIVWSKTTTIPSSTPVAHQTHVPAPVYAPPPAPAAPVIATSAPFDKSNTSNRYQNQNIWQTQNNKNRRRREQRKNNTKETTTPKTPTTTPATSTHVADVANSECVVVAK